MTSALRDKIAAWMQSGGNFGGSQNNNQKQSPNRKATKTPKKNAKTKVNTNAKTSAKKKVMTNLKSKRTEICESDEELTESMEPDYFSHHCFNFVIISSVA